MNRVIKSRIVRACALSVALTCAFTGCGIPGLNTETSDQAVEDMTVKMDLVLEEPSTQETTQEEPEQKESGKWDDPYEAFLAGEGTISIQYYMDNIYTEEDSTSYTPYMSNEDRVFKGIPSDKEYTLKEFRDALNDAVHSEDYSFRTPADMDFMEYAFLDCGADGNKELALRVTGPFFEPESNMTFVIKEMDGKLQVVYAFAEWARSHKWLYEYGRVCGYGSSGATVHGWGVDYINADGQYIFGYDYEEQSDLEDFARYEEHDDFDASGLEGEVCVYTLRTAPYDEATENDYYYSYIIYDEKGNKMDIPNLYTDSPYQKVMDSFKDISFISDDEMDKIAKDKLQAIGVVGRIGSGAELEYTEIDFDKEYVHDNTADRYKAVNNLQEELALIEERSVEFDNSDIDNMPQQIANSTSYQWYQLWDGELNDLWLRITDEIDADKKQALVEEQRAWVKRKEVNVYEAGSGFMGGTMQPLLENYEAMVFTRKRCYELATILAEIKGEEFQVPADVAESYKDVNLTLDQVFEKFQGQWIFDESRGACIGVERSKDYAGDAPEGSAWTVWETGGDIISDLDVYSYTDDNITFMVSRDGHDSYYKLRFTWEGDVELIYANSLEELYEQ